MKIAVLSRKASLYSTRRLVEAGRERGHEVVVIDYLRCYMNITAHRPVVMFQGKTVTDLAAIIPRIGASRTFYGASVVRQFEMQGVFSVNLSQAITRSRSMALDCPSRGLRTRPRMFRVSLKLPVAPHSLSNSLKGPRESGWSSPKPGRRRSRSSRPFAGWMPTFLCRSS